VFSTCWLYTFSMVLNMLNEQQNKFEIMDGWIDMIEM
jgi:hypothetical protein